MSPSDHANRNWLEFEEEQPRTSALAVASVVCGLGGVLICLPFLLPLLGLILGGAALAVMTGPSTNLRGRKLAFLGIAFSGLFLLVHVYGAMFLMRWLQQPMQGARVFFTVLEQGDFAAAHDLLTDDSADEVSEADLAELAEHLKTEYGPLVDLRIDLEGNILTYPLPGGERLLGFETGGDFPPLPLELEFRDQTVQGAVKAEVNRAAGPGDVPVRLAWLAFIEPDLGGVWTFPAGHLPTGVAMELNNTSWYICRDLDRSAEEYARALQLAEQACAIEPSGTYLNTLGVAQYRMGHYAEALATLQRADPLNRGIPEDIAFLAMAQHQLGNEEAAREQLQRLRRVMSERRRFNDAEARQFLAEAEQLIGG